jgi:tetratricopeptide (TPR) repeat protein
LGYIGEYDAAIKYLTTARHITLQLPFEQDIVSSLIANIYKILGDVHQVQNTHAKALNHYKEFWGLLPQLALPESRIKYCTELAQKHIQHTSIEIDQQAQKKNIPRVNHLRSKKIEVSGKISAAP